MITAAFFAITALSAAAQSNNIVEEVAWVVGDQPIWKSEIEAQYINLLRDKTPIQGDPYCVIPEMLAVEKLYLHQADMDTIEANQAAVNAEVDSRIAYYLNMFQTKEKLEEYVRKPLAEFRQEITDMVKNNYRVREVQRNLTANVKSTPNDVRRFYESMPEDSIPFIPLQVEAQIITINPVIPRQEIEDVKSRLRDYSDRVNSGKSEFSTLAILYSEDPGSSMRGGELGFSGKGTLDPEFAAVAFNLNDPKKVSKIVETEFGFHIIQLIEKRGDRINVRHILLRPKVSDNDLKEAVVRLDSLRSDIIADKVKFNDIVGLVSQEKTTRANRGMMVNSDRESERAGSTRFTMAELPQEVAVKIANMQPGDISEAFVMMDPKLNREVVAIVKLTRRIDGHKANLSEDYQTIKGMYEDSQRQKILTDWLAKKINETYVRIDENWRNCEFTHKGWIKEK
ncbi:MAG: peptidylprolyl isomerase [Paramuribaculum sp.]|nr:peptidylprolyl isomerase [Paramuribaculum sp.]